MTSDTGFGGLGAVESVFFQEGVALAPLSCCGEASATEGGVTVLATAKIADVRNGRLGGVVVPGRLGYEPGKGGRRFQELMDAARSSEAPVMAFGEGVAEVLHAFGYQPDGRLPPGVLVHNGVRLLETLEDVRDAVGAFHGVARVPVAAAS